MSGLTEKLVKKHRHVDPQPEPGEEAETWAAQYMEAIQLARQMEIERDTARIHLDAAQRHMKPDATYVWKAIDLFLDGLADA